MDGSSACEFFDLILGLFIEADVDAAGKLIVLDEAHKVSIHHREPCDFMLTVHWSIYPTLKPAPRLA